MKQKPKKLPQLVALIKAPHRQGCSLLLKEQAEVFKRAPGSRKKHHAWPGGYWDHAEQCMNWAIDLHARFTQTGMQALFDEDRFSLSDALVVLFVHDLEKPWRYVADAPCPIPVPLLKTKQQRAEFRLSLIEHYDIRMTAAQLEALKYVEGVRDDEYDPTRRLMSPLATLCHTADLLSAGTMFSLNEATQNIERRSEPNQSQTALI